MNSLMSMIDNLMNSKPNIAIDNEFSIRIQIINVGQLRALIENNPNPEMINEAFNIQVNREFI